MGRRAIGQNRKITFSTLPKVTLGRHNRRRHLHGEDPDTTAYIEAGQSIVAGNTTGTIGAISTRIPGKHRWALSELCKQLKGTGVWPQILAFYPFLFGNFRSASSSSTFADGLNVKTPTTSSTTFLTTNVQTFQREVSLGIKSPGSPSGNCNLGINPHTELSDFNWHIAFHGARRSGTSAGTNYGCDQAGSGALQMIFTDSSITYSGNALSAAYTPTQTNGLWVSTRVSTTSTSLYLNGKAVANNTTLVSTALPTGAITFFSTNLSANFYVAFCGFIGMGFGLTDQQASDYGDAVLRFITRLGRSV